MALHVSAQFNACMQSCCQLMMKWTAWLKSCNNSGHDLLTYSLWRCKLGITLSSPQGHLAYNQSDWLAYQYFVCLGLSECCACQAGDFSYNEKCNSFSGSAWIFSDWECCWSAPVSVCWGVGSVEEWTLKGLWFRTGRVGETLSLVVK